MSAERYFEDYVVGEARVSTGRTVTEADIVLHAGQTGDFYPHHMDAAWCATQPFKQRIAHGTLVFSVGVGLMAGEINPRAMSYGYDRLRFVNPVYIGDTLHVRSTISEKRAHKRPDKGLVIEHLEVLKQDDSVALVCDHIHIVDCRAGAA